MIMERRVVSITDYGRVEFRLKSYMDDRKITRNALARAINARFEVVNKWYQGDVEKIDADVLARICFALDCSPEDIIRYIPPGKE